LRFLEEHGPNESDYETDEEYDEEYEEAALPYLEKIKELFPQHLAQWLSMYHQIIAELGERKSQFDTEESTAIQAIIYERAMVDAEREAKRMSIIHDSQSVSLPSTEIWIR